MKRRLFPLTALLLAGSLTGCMQRSYDVQGRVVGFGDDGRTLIVEHADVPGLMPAMTMPFETAESVDLDGLDQGDAVRFKLVLTRDRSWIEDLVRLPDSAVARHPAGEPVSMGDGGDLLQVGDAPPPVTLLDQQGDTLRLADFEGRALLVTFIYTRCPLPDYCPLMSQQFQRLQRELVPRFGDQVHLLTVSFDPEYDTPAVLRAYASRYTEDLDTWTFATGSADAIAELTGAFGIYYDGEGEQLVHNLTTALIDPHGRVQAIWRGNTWEVSEVAEAVERILGTPSADV